MSLRPAQHWYLTCDTRDGDGQCPAFYLPPIRVPVRDDPMATSLMLAYNRDVVSDAQAAGWTFRQRESTWHCPEHGGAG